MESTKRLDFSPLLPYAQEAGGVLEEFQDLILEGKCSLLNLQMHSSGVGNEQGLAILVKWGFKEDIYNKFVKCVLDLSELVGGAQECMQNWKDTEESICATRIEGKLKIPGMSVEDIRDGMCTLQEEKDKFRELMSQRLDTASQILDSMGAFQRLKDSNLPLLKTAIQRMDIAEKSMKDEMKSEMDATVRFVDMISNLAEKFKENIRKVKQELLRVTQ